MYEELFYGGQVRAASGSYLSHRGPPNAGDSGAPYCGGAL